MSIYRILVVDDEPEAILPVKAVLEGAGYEVSAAKDGWDALSSARRAPPDLILLDVKMPQMDGWTFMKFLRAHRGLAEIPVIFLTGSTTPGDRDRGRRLGAVGYLGKPVDPGRLLGDVASALDRRGGPLPSSLPAQSGGEAPGGRFRMSGRMDQLGLLSLCSLLGAGARTGVLEVMRGPSGDRGRLFLRDGRIESARVEGLRSASGLEAVELLGKWREGAFTFIEEELLIPEDAAAAFPLV